MLCMIQYNMQYATKVVSTLGDRHRKAQHINLEQKLANGFSFNVEGDGPLTSDISYIRPKDTVKRQRLSIESL